MFNAQNARKNMYLYIVTEKPILIKRIEESVIEASKKGLIEARVDFSEDDIKEFDIREISDGLLDYLAMNGYKAFFMGSILHLQIEWGRKENK